VDIRRNSPHYMQWEGVELSEENRLMFYIPPGFAHGFVALSEEVHFSYKCTSEYNRESERGIRWDDPRLNIRWPIDTPVVSDRDRELPYLKDTEIFNDL